MQLLYLFEKIRNPFFDFLFSLITRLGEETVFLAIAIFVFWCINKREGYYILITGLVGTVVNQMLKLVCRVPRPWVKNPNFTIVESAREAASGYSFPSGHTQSIAGTLGAVGRYSQKKWVRISAIVIIALVALSRMYLGVHTPWDVLASLGIAAVLVFGLYPMFKTEERFKRFMPYIVGAAFAIAMGFLLYVLYMPDKGVLWKNPNYISAMKNAYTMFGCTLGLIVVYAFDSMYIDFKTKAPWYSQILKFAIGLLIVIGIKAGLTNPLIRLFGNEYVARAFRYFIIVVFAGIIWPLTFGFFAAIKVKSLDKFGEKVACLFSKRYAAEVEARRLAEKKARRLRKQKQRRK